MIKAIIFDFDGMVYLTKERFTERFSRDFNVSLDMMLPFFKNEFRKCQRGKLDLKDELKKYLSDWGWNKSVEELLEYWYKDGKLDKEMVELIKKIKEKGVKCILVTNNDKYRIEYLKKTIGLDAMFDILITSYDIGFFKSEKQMLEKVIELVGCKSEEILFCDDREGHIDLLKKVGFVPFLYKDIEQFKNELVRLKILA